MTSLEATTGTLKATQLEVTDKRKTQEEEDEEIWEKVETIQDQKFDMLKIILNLVKQFHSGMDIHKIQAPVHIIKPRSFLEETHFYIHPHSWFVQLQNLPDPIMRMLTFSKWVITNFMRVRHKGYSFQKPLNPILGEIFKCKFVDDANNSSTSFIAEQISHHPPVSAMYAENKKEMFSATSTIQAEMRICGLTVLHFFKTGEKYHIKFPSMWARNVLIGSKYVEVSGTCEIECPESKTFARINFKSRNQDIEGFIAKDNVKQINISGKHNDKVYWEKVPTELVKPVSPAAKNSKAKPTTTANSTKPDAAAASKSASKSPQKAVEASNGKSPEKPTTKEDLPVTMDPEPEKSPHVPDVVDAMAPASPRTQGEMEKEAIQQIKQENEEVEIEEISLSSKKENNDEEPSAALNTKSTNEKEFASDEEEEQENSSNSKKTSAQAPDTGKNILFDVNSVTRSEKMVCEPMSKQSGIESRKIWFETSKNIVLGNLDKAQKTKNEIEINQRKIRAEREANHDPYVPVYFKKTDLVYEGVPFYILKEPLAVDRETGKLIEDPDLAFENIKKNCSEFMK